MDEGVSLVHINRKVYRKFNTVFSQDYDFSLAKAQELQNFVDIEEDDVLPEFVKLDSVDMQNLVDEINAEFAPEPKKKKN